MIKFGIDASDVDAAAAAIGRSLNAQFHPHESDFRGGPYCRAEVSEGTLFLQRNKDPLNDEPFEMNWPANKLVLYLDGSNDEVWLPCVNALRVLNDPTITRLKPA